MVHMVGHVKGGAGNELPDRPARFELNSGREIPMKTALFASAAVIALAAFGTTASFAQSRDTIQIAGSSTVLPFSSIVAEEFGAAFPEFNTPVVGSGGTGGGFSQFCEGIGENTIDIANASRAMRDGEREACTAAGVTDIREIQFGFDGIVFASAASGPDFALTPVHVYKAIAAQVMVDGALVDNPYTTWSEVDASLPDQPIVLATAPVKSSRNASSAPAAKKQVCPKVSAKKTLKPLAPPCARTSPPKSPATTPKPWLV